MKTKNIIISILFLLLGISNISIAQDTKKEKPKKVRLKLEYIKLTDGTKMLKSKMYYRENKKFMPVVNQDVRFTAVGDSAEITLGTIKSDDEGYAVLYVENGFKFPVNSEGFTSITAKMKKSKKYKAAKRTLEVKDAELTVKLSEKDSLKKVDVKLSSLDSAGNTIPVSGEEVKIYVKRLYSLLELGSGTTNEQGKFTFDFPADIPGDSIGNLKIIVKIADSDNYGTIEKEQNATWGTVVSYAEENLPRALWGVEAPTWMIIAILVILSGAWFHFILAIYKVSQIRKVE